MPRHPTPLPDGLGELFRTDVARVAGVAAGRLRARDLARPFHGVRTRGADPTPAPAGSEAPDEREDSPDQRAREAVIARVRAHALVLPPHAFYTGSTALALWGMPLLDAAAAPTAPLEVGSFAPHRPPRRPGILAVQVRPGLAHTTMFRVPLTGELVCVATPATAWAMLARTHSEHDLVRLGDALVRIPRDDRGRRRPELQLVTPAQLQAAADAGRRQGVERMRRALPQLREHSMSILETDWRLTHLAAGLPEPTLDHEVRDAQHTLLGISDAAFVAARVAVEIDGDHHRTSKRQWGRDIQKQAAYAASGWEMVRLTSQHIRVRPALGIQMVRAALERRGFL
ncbi:MAG TPA: hypothetical protein PK929_15355 [Quisquiliibacterium sp.]|nr:hypothetical protein [Quisquiliibacterium sp.]